MPEARPYRTVSNRNFHGSEDSACRMSRNRARWRGRGRHTGEQTGLERSTHAALPVAHARRATRTCTRLVRRRTVETGACSARVSPPRSSLLSASLPSAIRRAAPPRCRRAASRRRPLTRHRRAERAERRAQTPNSARARPLKRHCSSGMWRTYVASGCSPFPAPSATRRTAPTRRRRGRDSPQVLRNAVTSHSLPQSLERCKALTTAFRNRRKAQRSALVVPTARLHSVVPFRAVATFQRMRHMRPPRHACSEAPAVASD